ncbi:MAG: metal-dependent hydrolase [Thiotrichales bacterium]|nr:metal-dependent hydrolase [Thiotrichales bacterium]
MDIVTQGLLGGVLAQSVARYEEKKQATVAGMVAGVLADADIFIQSGSDPLLNIEYHRHFTHSLIFIPLGAAIAFLILWPLLRKSVAPARLYVFCLAGFCMSGLLDACTSYGTMLFWPFSDQRIAWSLISIIDPVFTGILLLTLLLELRIKAGVTAVAGILLCAAYLGFSYSQQQKVFQIAEKTIALRDHNAQRHIVKPTLGNLVLWRSIYIHEQRIYVDAVRLGVFSDDRLIEGGSAALFEIERDMPDLHKDSVLYRDIRRFEMFSDGYVALDTTRENVLGDVRFSMLPTGTDPLWGILFDPARPEVHANYRVFRQHDRATRSRFVDLVLGRDP